MNTKLTINLKQHVIEKAKEYAKSNRTSLSKIIENHLQKITGKNDLDEKITPLVKSLSGIINLPKDFDHKKNYADHLITKYK